MTDPESRMRRGRAAADELAALREAVLSVRKDLTAKLEDSDPKDTDGREAAYFELRALTAVVRKLHAYVAEGQHEESRTKT